MNHHLLDFGLTKNFQAGDRVRVQVRIEALNATNYTLFGSGNVTLTSNQRDVHDAEQHRLEHGVMKPRDIQIGVRVTFFEQRRALAAAPTQSRKDAEDRHTNTKPEGVAPF